MYCAESSFILHCRQQEPRSLSEALPFHRAPSLSCHMIYAVHLMCRDPRHTIVFLARCWTGTPPRVCHTSTLTWHRRLQTKRPILRVPRASVWPRATWPPSTRATACGYRRTGITRFSAARQRRHSLSHCGVYHPPWTNRPIHPVCFRVCTILARICAQCMCVALCRAELCALRFLLCALCSAMLLFALLCLSVCALLCRYPNALMSARALKQWVMVDDEHEISGARDNAVASPKHNPIL